MLVLLVCLIVLLFSVRYCGGLGLLICVVLHFLCVGLFKLILFVVLLLGLVFVWLMYC